MDGLSVRKHVIPSSILKSWSQRAVSVDVSSKSCNQAVMGKCMGPRKAMARRDARRSLEASIDHLEAARPVVARPLLDTKVLHRPDSLHLILLALKKTMDVKGKLTSCIRVLSTRSRRGLRLRSLILRCPVRLLVVSITIIKLLRCFVSTTTGAIFQLLCCVSHPSC